MIDESAQVETIHMYYKDWLRINKKYIDGTTSNYMMLWQSFMAGWIIGRKMTVDETMEALKE
jgi:hypothetical protein